MYIDKLFELTEDLIDDNFNDRKEYNINFANITVSEIESMDVEEQMIALGMTGELNQYVGASVSCERASEDYENAKTYSSSTTAYHSSIVSDVADKMNKAYKTYEAATKIRQAAMETAEREIARTSAEAELKNVEYQTKHNEYISASNSSITQEKEDKLKVSNAYNIREEKKSVYTNTSITSSVASEDYLRCIVE